MAYTFLKAQGGEIGSSLCEDDRLDLANEILQKQKRKMYVFIYRPIVLLQISLLNDAETKIVNNDS